MKSRSNLKPLISKIDYYVFWVLVFFEMRKWNLTITLRLNDDSEKKDDDSYVFLNVFYLFLTLFGLLRFCNVIKFNSKQNQYTSLVFIFIEKKIKFVCVFFLLFSCNFVFYFSLKNI